MKYCKCLGVIKNNILPNQIVPIFAEKCTKAVQPDEINIDISELLRHISKGKLNKQTREHFTRLLTDYILEACNGEPTAMQETLQFLLDNLPSYSMRMLGYHNLVLRQSMELL